MKRLKRISNAILLETREHKASFMVYMVLRLLVILTMILQFFNRESRDLCHCKP